MKKARAQIIRVGFRFFAPGGGKGDRDDDISSFIIIIAFGVKASHSSGCKLKFIDTGRD